MKKGYIICKPKTKLKETAGFTNYVVRSKQLQIQSISESQQTQKISESQQTQTSTSQQTSVESRKRKRSELEENGGEVDENSVIEKEISSVLESGELENVALINQNSNINPPEQVDLENLQNTTEMNYINQIQTIIFRT